MYAQSSTEPYLFYTCSIISFLESRVDTYVENLEPFFECDPATKFWLENVWLPEEQEHGNLMKLYVEERWPRFLWEQGFDEFSNLYIPQCSTEKLRHSVGLEALARCVTETEATMIYRCLSAYAIDPELKQLLKRMSTDEVRHYRKFRDLHKQYELVEKNGFLSKARTLLSRSELVRDEDIALAFQPLNNNWDKAQPFMPWNYEMFLKYTANVMSENFPFREAKKMLFHPISSGKLIEKILIELMAVIATRQFLKYA